MWVGYLGGHRRDVGMSDDNTVGVSYVSANGGWIEATLKMYGYLIRM